MVSEVLVAVLCLVFVGFAVMLGVAGARNGKKKVPPAKRTAINHKKNSNPPLCRGLPRKRFNTAHTVPLSGTSPKYMGST